MAYLAGLAVLVVGLMMAVAGPAPAAARSVPSYNWSGYALRGAPPMDAVVLEFTVPPVTCTADNQALSIWAGFGGLLEQSLVQAGVQVRCHGTTPVYQLFEQLTQGTGASTEGPTVSPGDTVRVVDCPAVSTTSTGSCQPGAASAAPYLTSVAVRPAGQGTFEVWPASQTPTPWVVTRREAECIIERPRDATTLALLDAPQFTPPALRCQPYTSITTPVSPAPIFDGGNGYSAYRLVITPTPTTSPTTTATPSTTPSPTAGAAATSTGPPGGTSKDLAGRQATSPTPAHPDPSSRPRPGPPAGASTIVPGPLQRLGDTAVTATGRPGRSAPAVEYSRPAPKPSLGLGGGPVTRHR
ncbi:hypothetical protein LQ327_09550 [Actinomycetospora endophytica]|uniref:PASTA domain-containing protein n=1 Tax=Actinomycetospora endophytica TaxID=2291215 RepID=A0ABS8P7V6_9PSEU|nr:G1 family glutamic endopeptidase [Actinomycetospora endophytica]MCD2193625.1 hypothetical protein [Actinomycetospora endophytica]